MTRLRRIVGGRSERRPPDRDGAEAAGAGGVLPPALDIGRSWDADLFNIRDPIVVQEATGLDHGPRWRAHLARQQARAAGARERKKTDSATRDDEVLLAKVLDIARPIRSAGRGTSHATSCGAMTSGGST